jgi:hypothetical protein
VCEPIAVAV